MTGMQLNMIQDSGATGLAAWLRERNDERTDTCSIAREPADVACLRNQVQNWDCRYCVKQSFWFPGKYTHTLVSCAHGSVLEAGIDGPRFPRRAPFAHLGFKTRTHPNATAISCSSTTHEEECARSMDSLHGTKGCEERTESVPLLAWETFKLFQA